MSKSLFAAVRAARLVCCNVLKAAFFPFKFAYAYAKRVELSRLDLPGAFARAAFVRTVEWLGLIAWHWALHYASHHHWW